MYDAMSKVSTSGVVAVIVILVAILAAWLYATLTVIWRVIRGKFRDDLMDSIQLSVISAGIIGIGIVIHATVQASHQPLKKGSFGDLVWGYIALDVAGLVALGFMAFALAWVIKKAVRALKHHD